MERPDYANLNLDERYLDNPDLIRRLPVHDDYFTNPEAYIPYNYKSSEETAYKRYIGSGITFVSLVAENLLSHPFLVLRRQCQVHHTSRRYHLQPFTLLPPMWHLYQRQGLTCLWKGVGSSLLVRGMSLGVEDLLSKVTPWPKEINLHSSLKQFCHHMLLKCISLAVVAPFYSHSFVETVQSEIASEKPGILDVFREGLMRLLNWGIPANGRMLPIWALIVPTVALGLARYLFTMMVQGISVRILVAKRKNRHEENGALPKDLNNATAVQDIELAASIVSAICSDIAFFPCETIIHRIHLQGTRTIVDNLDNGISVLPILTNYTGAIDCYESCLAKEGVCGLYKGFGALVLQYVAHIALIKVSHFILTQLGTLLQGSQEPSAHKPVKTSPPVISNMTNQSSSYLLP